MTIRIKQAETEKELHQLYQFRYQIYVDEMARTQLHADHQKRIIVEPLDETGLNIIALDDDTVVGGLRTNFSKNSELSYYADLYEMDRLGKYHPGYTSITTKLMVRKDLRKGRLAIQLAQAAYVAAVKEGILFDFIDCNDHLLGFFKLLGYRQISQKISHKEYGEVTPLVLTLNDIDYFRKIGSPFLTLNKCAQIKDESVDYFYTLIGESNLIPTIS
ncbi:MAG: GNAT family N-acetyltransferase [Cyanobacteria bacterium]|nr:GNAT family N-acetyltransferase [Cyanobacteriota bacterium]